MKPGEEAPFEEGVFSPGPFLSRGFRLVGRLHGRSSSVC